MQTNEIE